MTATTRKTSTTRKTRKPDLSGLFAKPAAAGKTDDDRKWLSDVPASGIAKALRPIVSGTVTDADGDAVIGMVRSMVGDAVSAAADALKGAEIDPSRVSLSTKGNGKVTANLSIPFTVDGSTRYLNVYASVDGMAGQILATYAQHKG